MISEINNVQNCIETARIDKAGPDEKYEVHLKI